MNFIGGSALFGMTPFGRVPLFVPYRPMISNFIRFFCHPRGEFWYKYKFRGGMAERLKAAVLKTAERRRSVGSNPTPSAREFGSGGAWIRTRTLRRASSEEKRDLAERVRRVRRPGRLRR